MGVESFEDRAVVPGRRLMEIFAVVQQDPRPVLVPDTNVNVGRLKVKLPGADNELALAYDGHRRHIHPRKVRRSSSPQRNCITS